MKYDITQPWKTLDPWQKEYIETPPEQNCFLLTGRQVGKTASMAIKSVEMSVRHFGKEQNILICSITEKQAYRMLAKALVYAKIKYRDKLIQTGKERPTMHRILFGDKVKSGSKWVYKNIRGIYCYAAGETGEGLRGDTIKKLMIDEGSRMSEEFFISVTPMLSVAKGSLDIASTPFGKRDKENRETFFYKCSFDDSFKKFYASAEDCPRHSKEFLAKEKERMTKLQYAQEYLAKFLDDLQRVFSDKLINEICILKRKKTITEGTYFLGCDVGRKKDPFTFEILQKIDDELIQVENIVIKDVSIPDNVKRIIRLNEQYHFKKEYIDSGGMGIAVCDILRDDEENKRKVVEINNASRRFKEEGQEKRKGILKQDLYKNLITLMERRKIKLLDDEEIKLSLSSVQIEIDGEKEIYFGNDTHIVEGLIRACWGIKNKSLNIYIY